mmetsp:Transcript_26481/g.90532  ORF Transcript_26481/g.90532 Transcript_26481/m.90532 type:complete len:149 (-) Transcript_26481:850-1296(-)
MAALAARSGLGARLQAPRSRVAARRVARSAVAVAPLRVEANLPKVARQAAAATVAAVPAAVAAPVFAATEAINDVALEGVNILGLIATALFIIIPTSFLLILYVKSASEGNVSGGSQAYYDNSKKGGNKKTNEAAVFKGEGVGMYFEE